MLRKTFIALAAAASIGLLVPGAASARGFGHGGGGGWHGGGWHGGWGGGGWRRRGWYGGGWGWGWGAPVLGFYSTPYYYDDYGYAYCRYRTVRIHTPWGWRWGRRRICW